MLLPGAFLLAGAGAAPATEIAPPPPLTSDLGDLDARGTLSRWLGLPAPGSRQQLISTATPPPPGIASSLLSARGDRPALTAAWPRFTRLPPRPLFEPGSSAATGRFEVLLGTNAGPTAAQIAAPGEATIAGGTRFDVRPSARNPIRLGGDAVDLLTARVVRTPEPATLALFALGVAGLAVIAARRRRRDG